MNPPTDADLHRTFLQARRVVLASSRSGALQESGGWQLYDSDTGLGPINQAMTLDGAGSASIEVVGEWYRKRGAAYSLVLQDGRDQQLIEDARRSGFTIAQSQPVMVRSLPCPAEMNRALHLRPVESSSDAAAFLAVRRDPTKVRPPDDTETAFILRLTESGTFRYFVAELEGEVVGAVTSSCVGETAMISNLLVAPAWRLRGLGADITARSAANWPQAKYVTLEASSEGAFLYTSMGFERRFNYVRFVLPEAG
ncbi:MAG: GNAT family N-acetyltransferase [Dehalococcoidia bacterium]